MRIRRMACVLVPLTSLSLLGCFSSTNDEGVQGDAAEALPDAGSTEPIDDATAPDAGQVVPTPEASVAMDAGIDVVEEPLPLPVTVVVTGPSGPESGKIIVFSDSLGSFVAAGTTNAQGIVVQDLVAGSQATAILGTPGAPQLVTVTGVQPGDRLTAFDSSQPETETQTNFDLPLPIPEQAVAGQVFAGSNCSAYLPNATTTTGSVTLFAGCLNSTGQYPLLALAEDDDGVTVGYAYQKGNNAIGADGGEPTVAIPGPWSSPVGQETVTVSNLASEAQPFLSFEEVATGVPYFQYNYDLAAEDGGISSPFDTHPGYPDSVQGEVDLETYYGNSASVQAIATRVTPSTVASPNGSIAIDASDVLPVITAASLSQANPQQPVVTITPASPLTAAAATFVSGTWQDSIDGGAVYGTWTIVVPSSVTSVAFPALPSNLGGGPSATADWDAIPTVAAIGGGPFASYNALRSTAAVIGVGIEPSNVPFVPALPANGTVQVTAFYENVESEGVAQSE